MRRRKILAAVMTACLAMGSVTTGWAAWEWSDTVFYYSATMESSTEYFTGQAVAQGEVLAHVTVADYEGHKNYREEVLPVCYLNKEDGIYIMDLSKQGEIFDGSRRDNGFNSFYKVEFSITGVIPEEDGSVRIREGGDETVAGIFFATNDGEFRWVYSDNAGGWVLSVEDTDAICEEDLEYSEENTTIMIEPFYSKLREVALAKGHQPEDYVYLLEMYHRNREGVGNPFIPKIFIRFAEDGTAETPVSSAPRTGVWKEDRIGWWIAYPDGSYLVNGWYQSPESGLWYYMGADGYMLENRWLQDPGSGLWYYLGNGGAMLTSAYTPDGYWVGADGVWAQ